MASPIRIAVLANAAQAKRELASVQTSGSKMSRGLKVAGKVAAAGLLIVGAAAISAGKAAAADEAAQSKLAQTSISAANATKSQIKAQEAYVTAAGKSLGITDDELRPALSKLVTATGSLSKAQKLANVAMDVSAGSGKNLESVAQALAKAQATGNVAALSKYGVATKDADGKTRSLSAVMADLANKHQGAAAKAAQTTAGKQKILSVQMGELQEQIGAKLLPVMAKLAEVGLQVIAWAEKNSTVAKTLGVIVGGLAAAILVANAAIKVYTISQTILNAVMSANPIGLVVLAIAALVAGLFIAYKKSETFRKIVDQVGQVGKKAFGLILTYLTLVTTPQRKLLGIIKDVATWVGKNVPAAYDVLKEKTGKIAKALLAPFKSLKDFIQSILDKIKKIKVPDLNPFNNGKKGGEAAGKTFGPNAKVVAESTASGSARSAQPIINVYPSPFASPVDVGREVARSLQAFADAGGRL